MPKNRPNIDKFDLKLLGVFEAIYKFGSVTKAAHSLKQAPSSISQSLQKLRVFFSDPLFVRTGAHLTATTMAETIHLQISSKYNNLLERLEKVVNAASKDILVIHCSTYLSLRVVPPITQWVEKNAPDCRVVYREFMRHQDTSEDLLLQRGVDLVFDMLPAYNFSLCTLPVMLDETIFCCRRNHPRVGSHISVEEALLEKFALFDTTGLDLQYGQVKINQELGDRNFSLISGSILTIAATIASSDIIGVIPLWLYNKWSQLYDIRALDSDVKLTPFPIYMMHSKSSLQNTIFKELCSWLESNLSEQLIS